MRHRLLIVASLLPCLAGCTALNSDGNIPQAGSITGMAAHDEILQQQVRPGHGGQPDQFQPLIEARAAVEKARTQLGADQVDADLLRQAETELEQVQNSWSQLVNADERDPARLAEIAARAHEARRHAQIARYTAQHETGLAQLEQEQAELQRQRELAARRARAREARRRAQAAARKARQARASAARDLLGQRVLPDRCGALAFDSGTARLQASSRSVIKQLAALLQDNPAVGVAILGHTSASEPGAESLEDFISATPQLASQDDLSHDDKVNAYNLALSNARARAVAGALVQSGVNP